MKIMQVIPHLGLGGAESMCVNLSEALTEQGHQVVVVSLYTQETYLSDRLLQKKVKVVFLDKNVGPDFSLPGKLLSVLLQEKPDVIHTHLLSLKYVCLAVRKMDRRIPVIHTVHSVAEQEAGRMDRLINRWFFRKGYALPVALSREIQKTVAAVYGLEPRSVPVVFNGIRLANCKVKQDYGANPKFTILHIGRFMDVKNHGVLLRAFQKLHQRFPQSRLQLIGKGERKQEMEALASELSLQDAVSFLGEQTDVFSCLQEADLFVLPSLYEGMPMTILEAMGTGLPVIASAVGGIPDVIRDGEDGILIRPLQEELEEAMARLLCDQGLREKLGRNALKKSRQFSDISMANRYLDIYHAERCSREGTK